MDVNLLSQRFVVEDMVLMSCTNRKLNNQLEPWVISLPKIEVKVGRDEDE